MSLDEFCMKGAESLKFFTYNILSDSYRDKKQKFTGGAYVDEILDYYQKYDRTMVMAPRKNFKTDGIHSVLAWYLWRLGSDEVMKWLYLSYSDSLAMRRVGDFKEKINNNRFFRDASIKDLKPTADSVVKYTWNGKNSFSIIPASIGSFKRGDHMNTVCDDILADPTNQLNLTIIDTINTVFRDQIYEIPMDWDKFHIVGTPQTNQDFFFDKEYQEEFNFRQYKAIVNEVEKKALWEEWEPFEKLIKKRGNNPESERWRSFMKEKMCMPQYSANAYLSETALRKRINLNLVNIQFNPVFVLDCKFEKAFEDQDANKVKEIFKKFNINLIDCSVFDYDKKWDVGDDYLVKLMEDKKDEFYLAVYKKRLRPMSDVVAGIDPGKMVHPAFYTVFEKVGDKWVQLHLQWMHHWDYKDQIEHINLGRDLLDVDYTYYDSTRGEYEGFVEKGDLDSSYVPVNFGSKDHRGNKMKKSLAAQMNVKLIESEGAELINDETQILVMLTVDRELIAVETNIDGRKFHGDSFWGVALAIGGGEVMSKMRVI